MGIFLYNGGMESISLGNLGSFIIYISSLIGAGAVIVKFTLGRLQKVINESLRPTNEKIDVLATKVNQVDVDNSKNYLQQTFSALDAGEKLDSVAIQRFYEVYDHYTDELHLNSWVHIEKERLEREGKLKRK